MHLDGLESLGCPRFRKFGSCNIGRFVYANVGYVLFNKFSDRVLFLDCTTVAFAPVLNGQPEIVRANLFPVAS